MDIVTHEGKEYKKVAILAKEFNYTTDYIGQLCRAKKVDARLVGRAWYVNPDSLKKHKQNRYQDNFKQRIEEQSDEKKADKNYLSRVDVEAVRTNKTHKIIKHVQGEFKELAVRYEADDQSLLPRIVKKEKRTSLPVKLADSSSQITKNSSKKTILRPEALPEVSPEDVVAVSDTREEKNTSLSEEVRSRQPVSSIKVARTKKTEPNAETKQNRSASKKVLKKTKYGSRQSHTEPKLNVRHLGKTVQRASFSPRTVASNQQKRALLGIKKNQNQLTYLPKYRSSIKQPSSNESETKEVFWRSVIIFATILIAAALLTIGIETTVVSEETHSKLLFQKPVFLDSF